MIQPNELRIGNCVLFEGELKRIISITSSNTVRLNIVYFTQREKEDNELDPIPLTPELLEKCGFVEKGHVNQDQDDVEWMQHPALPDLKYRDGFFRFEDLELPHIQHFHQLQNLYFCLTGEELTVKL